MLAQLKAQWRAPARARRGLAGVTAALTAVPLVGTLGYESSLVLCPLFAVSSALLAAHGVAHPVPLPLRLRRDSRELALRLGLCLLILITAALWQPNCDPLAGAAFFAMGPLCSAVLGWGAGWLAAHTVKRGRRIAALMPFLASTGVGLYRLYADPVVFAYDPFWGYFSGAIYDEDVAVRGTYVAFRLYNLAALAAAVCIWRAFGARSGSERRSRAWLVLGTPLVAVALWMGLTAASRGFTADADSIRTVLRATRSTPHFEIHYHPRSATADEIDVIALEHEFAWHQLAEKLGTEPVAPVRSFIFDSPGQKRRLMGAGQVEVAAPWRRQIYLNHKPFPHAALHHELAHVFAGTAGDDLLGISRSGPLPNLAMVEGVATALAPRPQDHLDLHDQAAILDRLGKRPPMAEILGPMFWSRASRVAYTAAGSFCLWLLEQHGWAPLARAYGAGGDFAGAYNTPLADLEEGWVRALRERSIPQADVDRLAVRFQRRPIFSRPCAHRAAKLLDEVAAAQDRGAVDEAIEHLETLCRIEAEVPEHRVRLGHAHARSGRDNEAEAALERAAAFETLTSSQRAAIAEDRADLAMRGGRWGAAREYLDLALAEPMYDSARRAIELKRMAVDDPLLAPLVTAYFAPYSDGDRVQRTASGLLHALRIAEHAPRLGAYLVARQLLNAGHPRLAAPYASAAVEGSGALPSAAFERAAVEMRLRVLGHLGDWGDVETLAKHSLTLSQGAGHRATAQMWIDRARFAQQAGKL